MRYISTILLLSLGMTALSQQTINASIMHDGIQRDYTLYIPASYTGSSAVPLVFNFHGYTSNAQQQMFYGDFRPIADTANFIIVHPQGTNDNTGNPHFNVGFGGSTVNDLGFTSALLDTLLANYNIDDTRVYSTGMSNGGYMSLYIACQLSGRFAAVASVTGSMTVTQTSTCSPGFPMPVLQIHGTSDATVPYNGGGGSESIQDVLDYWVGHNGCNTSPTTTSLPDLNSSDGSTVEHIVYEHPTDDITVEHFKITGGTHTWPGAAFDLGGTNYDINASNEIWWFFLRQQRSNPTTDISFHSTQSVEVYPNPARDQLTVQGGLDGGMYAIQNATGQIVLKGSLNGHQTLIDLDVLVSGIYFLLTDGTDPVKFIKE